MTDHAPDQASASGNTPIPPYRNPRLTHEERARDLLLRMTLEEKAAQMVCVWNEKATTLVDEQGHFDLEKARRSFGAGHGLGQVGRPSDAGGGRSAREQAELTNAIQRFFLEESRLGIPVIFHEECLHGQAAPGGTSFPQPIALASSFDTELVEALYAMTAEEARSRGTHQALTPVVDVARDPRWGRVEETFGEDPYLVSRMGVAAVNGFQGDRTFENKTSILATLKHFAAHGQPEGGMNCAPANVSERELRATFLSPFRAAIKEGRVASVMASYNEIDGIPSHANRWLLRDVLRDEWGFDGFVVSDYYAIWELHDRPDTHGHHVASDKKDACRLAVEAGVNIELPEPDCYRFLVDLVHEGTLREDTLDELVMPMLLSKFRLGLFDDPYVDPDHAEKIVGSERNSGLALRAALESIVMLKNDDSVLPLNLNDIDTIAVIGPNAERCVLGGYSGAPPRSISVLEGIKSWVDERAQVLYSKGCGITVDGSWNRDEVLASDPDEDRRLIREAVAVAEQADVVVLAVGGNEQTSREAWALTHMGDRTNLDPVGRQNELVDAIASTGKPVVVLLFNGRPLSISAMTEKVPVILECWYLGQETGHAVARTLFGDYNPAGKLPISFPRSAGHLPVYYNHKPSARRGYLFDDVSPLYPFGFGLSYTTFVIGNPRLEDETIRIGEPTRALADVTNTGDREGSEVVQLYVRDQTSSVTRPVRELRGFERVTLKAGETRTVAFDIAPASLSFYDINMDYVVEPGAFEIMIGSSSQREDLQSVILRVTP